MDKQRINHLYSVSNRFSATRLALNYYTLMERHFDGEFNEGVFSALLPYLDKVSAMIKVLVVEEEGYDNISAVLNDIEALRAEITANMETLTIYTDHFENFEYVLNRIEFRFIDGMLELPDSDAELIEAVMSYVFGESDNALANMKIQMVLSQLPLRMTRQKFYGLLTEGLSVYQSASKKSIDDMMFFLQTVSGIKRPPETASHFLGLNETLELLEKTDFKGIDKEQFEKITEKFKKALDTINFFADVYLLLQEIVNDLYVLLLTNDYNHDDYQEQKVKKELVSLVMAGDFSEQTENLLVSLEGRQESLYERYLALESVIDDCDKESADYQTIMKISRLLSNSSFMALAESTDAEVVEEGYLEQAKAQLLTELDVRLKAAPIVLRRAIMAKVLSTLPVFFHSAAEFQKHVENCIVSCSDVYEKNASMALLKELIETDALA